MKKIISLLAIILLFASVRLSYGQDKVKGGYKVCTVYNYKYKFGELDSSSKTKSFSKSYDEKGNQTGITNYTTDDKISSKISFKYDAFGSKTDVISYYSDGTIYHKDSYKNDEKGNKIALISYNRDGSIDRDYSYKNKFDVNGNLIEEKEYKADGSLSKNTTYKYNDKGRMIEQNEVTPNGILTYKRTIKYDDIGNKIDDKWTYTSPESEPFNSRSNYKYDQKGNMVTEIKYDWSKQDVVFRILSYKCDDYGNTIETIECNSLNDPENKQVYIYN